MSLDGISRVEARIDLLRARMATLGAPVAPPPAATTPVAGGEFASVLGGMLQDGGPSSAGAAHGSCSHGTCSHAGHVSGGAGHVDHAHLHGPDGKLQPPAELKKYGNGKIPRDALALIGVGQHRLWAPAGRSFQALVAAAEREGINIGVTDSYRSYEAQVDVARRKGLYSQGGLAATPGTSNHGWGMSVDLDLDDRAQAWMRANAHRYGFEEDVPREPWHWTYHGV